MCIVFFQAFDPQSPPSSSSSPDTQTPADGGLSAEEQAVAQRYAFVLASNRDEYLTRPTKRAHLWEPQQAAADGAVPPAVAEQQGAPAGGEVILAGKDLLGGGTWLGVTRSGRVSVLTNYRTPGDDAVAAATAAVTATEDGNGGGSSIATVAAVGRDMKKKTEKRSRGQLVLQFLHGGGAAGGPGPLAYGERVVAEGGEYAGFNLMVADLKAILRPPHASAPPPAPSPPPALVYVSNKADPPLRPLAPNRLYAMANRLLDTPWEKLTRGKGLFRACLGKAAAVVATQGGGGDDDDKDAAVARVFLHELLDDGHACAPATDTGYGLEVEGKLASICIPGVCLREGAPLFGTSTQMVLLARRDGRVVLYERTLLPGPTEDGARRSQRPDWHWSEVERFELALE